MAKKRATPKTSTAKRKPSKGGRPPKYDPKFHPRVAKALCAKGATIAEIANAFGVAISTIWQWKINHEEFFESGRLGLEAATDRVEHSMFERAVGYTHESMKIFMPAGAKEPVYALYLEHVPPDPRAGEFWLTNRAPDRWKNKQNVEHNEAADSPIRLLAEQISGRAIRPRLPEPTIIEHDAYEPSAIRPQHNVTTVTTDEVVTRAQAVTHDIDDVDDDEPRHARRHRCLLPAPRTHH
jgi:transposase-like protein